MMRRQFLAGIAAIATAAMVPFKRHVSMVSWWNRNTGPIQRIAEVFHPGPVMHMDFTEIEARVMAYLENKNMVQDGLWHQYGYNTRGEVFVDGKNV